MTLIIQLLVIPKSWSVAYMCMRVHVHTCVFASRRDQDAVPGLLVSRSWLMSFSSPVVVACVPGHARLRAGVFELLFSLPLLKEHIFCLSCVFDLFASRHVLSQEQVLQVAPRLMLTASTECVSVVVCISQMDTLRLGFP